MPWGAVAGAVVGGVVNSALAPDSGGSSQSSSAPWSEQQPYLTYGFGQAKDLYNTAAQNPVYQGQRVAGMNPWQTQGLNSTANFAANQGLTGANAQVNAGTGAVGNLTSAGNNAAGIFSQAQQDPTQQIIGNAGMYANNPYLSGMVDAASRDVVRNLNENQLTGLDAGAAATGNMNSSRTGVAQGIMERGAADRIGDISAQLRGNAYNTGLGMAQTQYNTGMGQQLSANGQLMTNASLGNSMLTSGLTNGINAGSAMTNVGSAYQTQDQNLLNANMQAFKDAQNNPMDLLSKYMGLIQGGYGNSTTSSSTPGNTGTAAVSGALSGLGLYNKWANGSLTGGQVPQGYLSGNSTDPLANSNADLFTSIATNYDP